jgi:3-oxoacyl-[acyl-carrier protein] reductase
MNNIDTPTSDPRVALVTGASGGIGRAVAQRLGAEGMAAAVHYADNEQRAQEAAAAVGEAGGKTLLVQGDIADEREVAGMFDAVEEAFGGIDVVVNTAGIMLLAPLAELDLADFDRRHRTNVRGTFVVSQQAARRVRPEGRSSTSRPRS